jgi:hypothetical protein
MTVFNPALPDCLAKTHLGKGHQTERSSTRAKRTIIHDQSPLLPHAAGCITFGDDAFPA